MALAIVGSHTASGNNVATATTSSWSATAGNLYLAVVCWYSAGASDISLSDTNGETWTQIGSTNTFGASTNRVSAWYLSNGSGGGSYSVTSTRGDSTYTIHLLRVYEISAADTSSPIDVYAFANGSSTTPSVTTATSAANALAFGFVGARTNATFTEDSNFTGDGKIGFTSLSMNCATRTADAIAVTYAPTISVSQIWGGMVVAVKPASGGPTTYDDDISESAALSSDYSNQGQFNASVAEAATLTTANSSAGIFADAVSESLATSFDLSTGNVFLSSVTENLSLLDAISGAAEFANSVEESLSSSMQITDGNIYAAELEESLNLSDVYSNVAFFTDAIVVTLTLADAVSSTGIFGVSVAESMSADFAIEAVVDGESIDLPSDSRRIGPNVLLHVGLSPVLSSVGGRIGPAVLVKVS